MYGVYLLKFHPGWSVRDSFLYASSYCVTYPFYAPLNLQADKLIILIIFFNRIMRSSPFLGQALRYVLFLTLESMILQCEQSLFFLLSHYISEHASGVRIEATRNKLLLPQSLLLCIINLHMFTFSLTAGGSEERGTTARGLLKVACTSFPLF